MWRLNEAMTHSGKCLCGAISYQISAPKTGYGACHCANCRRSSGGVFFGLTVVPDEIRFQGLENLTTYASSPWAERCFCKICGANIYFRPTSGPTKGTYEIAAGTLDDHAGLTLKSELFIEDKPAAYAFACDTRKIRGSSFLAANHPELAGGEQ